MIGKAPKRPQRNIRNSRPSVNSSAMTRLLKAPFKTSGTGYAFFTQSPMKIGSCLSLLFIIEQ